MLETLAFDSDAADVLATARELARDRGEGTVGPHLVLVALAKVGPADVRRALERFGFRSDSAEDWLDVAVGPILIRTPLDPQSEYSDRARAVLDAAAAEADDRAAPAIGARDLLLGLLREPFAPRGIAANALIRRGATCTALRAALGD